MSEQGNKNEHISDSDKKLDALADMIRDACAKIDDGHKRLDARMDAVEEKFREDSARRDAAKADEGEAEDEPKADADEEAGEPKEPVADRRKDSAGERQKEGYVEDSDGEDEDRKDADDYEDADEGEDGAEADHAPMTRAEAAQLRAEIAALQKRTPAMLSMADRERFASIQEAADPAFQAFGDRAPAPLQGETPLQYKRRLGSKLQSHSPKWKDARLSAVADEALIDTVLSDVYADAITAARRGVDVPVGQLREVVHHRGGHTIVEFEGYADSWMNQFAGNSQRGTGNWMRPN